MIVVNKVGFAVSPVDKIGRKYKVPFDGKKYTLPDELFDKYKELFHIVIPPKVNVEKKIDNKPKIEEKVIKKVLKKRPLEGKKIKAHIRSKLNKTNRNKYIYYKED